MVEDAAHEKGWAMVQAPKELAILGISKSSFIVSISLSDGNIEK
jgi:hypothetical protein